MGSGQHTRLRAAVLAAHTRCRDSTVTQQPTDLLRAFAELGRIRLGETDLGSVCARAADIASRTIPHADDASMTVVREHHDPVAAFSSQRAERLRDAGPAVRAAAENVTVYVPDTMAEAQWRDWMETAAADGVRSVLSIGLPVHETATGAITVFSRTPAAFDQDAIRLTETLAGYATVALANIHLYDTTAGLAEHMRRAMEHRAVIEQAKGIIMSERRCSADEAFAVLAKLSQDSNRKLRDVAAALVARSTDPSRATRGGRASGTPATPRTDGSA
jgi:GAF domain-containing protein